MAKRFYHLTAVIGLFTSLLCAQDNIIVPKRVNEITIDGEVNDEEWKDAFVINQFKQINPNLGANQTEFPTVSVLYDERFLYFAAKCVFEDSKRVFATTLERDFSQDKDDFVEIHLDTYNDKANTLIFRTNPLGARQDYESVRNGEEFNNAWNTFWIAQSKINPDGWSTEFRIPFTSLRYQSAEKNVMRLKVVINYKLNNELLIWPLENLDVSNTRFHFTNSKEIVFNQLPSSKPLYIAPYSKATFSNQNVLNPSGTDYVNEKFLLESKGFSENKGIDKLLSNVGLDVKFKPRANQTLDVTLNTDFAEVEVDDRIINISRFPILLPEKRLFFLENSDLFNSNQFDHRLFNSRSIGIRNGTPVPIIAGLRFIGGNEKWQYGLLDMQTSDFEDLEKSTNYSVVRSKLNLGKLGSYIGFLNTNKVNYEEYNSLFAVDANIRLTNIIRTRFAFGATFDDELGNWRPFYGASITNFQNNGFGFQYRFREYTDRFNPEMGFVSQPNTKRFTTNHGWRKAYRDHKSLRSISLGHYMRKNWLSNSGLPDIFQTNMYFSVRLKKGDLIGFFAPVYREDNLYNPWNFSRGFVIPEGRYKMWTVNPYFNSGSARPYQFRSDVTYGEFYGGRRFTIASNFAYEISQFSKIEVGGTFNQLNFPSSYSETNETRVDLSRYFTRLKLSFSTQTSLNSFVQYDTRSKQVGLNIRFRYNPIEGTDFFVVYNHNANTDMDFDTPTLPFTNSQLVILKFTKTFIQ